MNLNFLAHRALARLGFVLAGLAIVAALAALN